jgi:hypothetical protein
MAPPRAASPCAIAHDLQAADPLGRHGESIEDSVPFSTSEYVDALFEAVVVTRSC